MRRDPTEFRKRFQRWKNGDNPYSAGKIVDAIYKNNPKEEFLGEPDHHYDFTQSEEWADAHGYYPDERGHRDDRVKKPAHPSHPSRGRWFGDNFILTEKGMQDPNYIFFGLNDGGQDPQAVLKYKDGIVLPEITVTPKGNYFYNSYDNIRLRLPKYGNGKESIENGQYADTTWHEQWLKGRQKQLQENINTANNLYKKESDDIYNEVTQEYNKTKDYLSGISDRDLPNGVSKQDVLNSFAEDYYRRLDTIRPAFYGTAEEEITRQIQNIGTAKEYYNQKINPRYGGIYTPRITDDSGWESGHIIKYPTESVREGVKIHERTHASDAIPQQRKIEEINKKYNYSPQKGADAHFYDPNELYSEMNDIRKSLNFSPGQVIGNEDLNRIRKHPQGVWFRDKSDEQVLEYFNEVASNPNPLFNPGNILNAYGPYNAQIKRINVLYS